MKMMKILNEVANPIGYFLVESNCGANRTQTTGN